VTLSGDFDLALPERTISYGILTGEENFTHNKEKDMMSQKYWT
jgi:hypothetical protein